MATKNKKLQAEREELEYNLIYSLCDANIILPNVFDYKDLQTVLIKQKNQAGQERLLIILSKLINWWLDKDEREYAISILLTCEMGNGPVLKKTLKMALYDRVIEKLADVVMYYCCKFGLEPEAVMILENKRSVLSFKIENPYEETALMFASKNKMAKFVRKYCEKNPYGESIESIHKTICMYGDSELTESIKEITDEMKLAVLRESKNYAMVDVLFRNKSLGERITILKEQKIQDSDNYKNSQMTEKSDEEIQKLYEIDHRNKQVRKIIVERKMSNRNVFNIALENSDDEIASRCVDILEEKETMDKFVLFVKKGMDKCCMNLLVESKIDIGADYDGKKILEFLSENKLKKSIKFIMLKYSESIDTKDVERCFLNLCKHEECDDTIKMILDKYKVINAIGNDGRTGLIIACGGKSESLIRLLTEYNPDAKIVGPDGSALMICLKNDNICLASDQMILAKIWLFENSNLSERRVDGDGKFVESILSLSYKEGLFEIFEKNYKGTTVCSKEVLKIFDKYPEFLEKIGII